MMGLFFLVRIVIGAMLAPPIGSVLGFQCDPPFTARASGPKVPTDFWCLGVPDSLRQPGILVLN